MDNPELIQSIKESKIKFGNPDFKMLADSFGFNEYKFERTSDFKHKLKKALVFVFPGIIVCHINYKENCEFTIKSSEIKE